MKVLDKLQPSGVFKYFEDICSIPHGSYNTKGLSNYCVDFAKEYDLSYIQDQYNNVIIKKPASIGYEHIAPVIIQGHLDMVCEKNDDTVHDFIREPLYLYIEDDYIKAQGTTLGGDDGIAVAYALAILEDDTIKHPPLEIVLTTEEEVGMEGACGLDTSNLSGEYMLNLDSEDEGIFTVSCAGGVTVKPKILIDRQIAEGNLCHIKITGLLGGHSGVNINNNRENANKLLGIYLSELLNEYGINLVNIGGGLKNNAIPRESFATFVVGSEYILGVEKLISDINNRLYEDICPLEPDFKVTFDRAEVVNLSVFDNLTTFNIINFINEVPNGVIKMSRDIDNLPETSLNLGVVTCDDNTFSMEISIRSSVEEYLDELKDKVLKVCDNFNLMYDIEGRYPSWKYNKDSKLRDLMVTTYEDMYGCSPKIEAIHAGLECGIILSKMPKLDIVSTGPDILDIHTPKERLSISSVARTWDFILNILERSIDTL